MDESDFDGTLILEKLAAAGTVDAFFEAVDSDDFEKARQLMRGAGLDASTIQIVMKKMADPDGEH